MTVNFIKRFQHLTSTGVIVALACALALYKLMSDFSLSDSARVVRFRLFTRHAVSTVGLRDSYWTDKIRHVMPCMVVRNARVRIQEVINITVIQMGHLEKTDYLAVLDE
jgi:hypothetical protein